MKKPATSQYVGPDLGGFVTTQVIKTFTPITADPHGGSIGSALDAHLIACAREGMTVQSVSVDLTDETWAAICAAHPVTQGDEAMPYDDFHAGR